MAALRLGSSLCLALLLMHIQAGAAAEAKVTPIAKVLQLMDELRKSVTKEKNEEASKFAKFDTWCKGQKKTKGSEIKEDKTKIAKLTADIEKGRVLIKGTDDRIKELEEDVSRWTKDKGSATTVRSREKADYDATVKSYGESLAALDRAIELLKKQAYTRDQAELLQESLLQVQSRRLRSAPPMPSELVSTLTALTQESATGEDMLSETVEDSLAESSRTLSKASEAEEGNSADKATGKPAGYEFQSGGVVDMLAKLKTQFSDEKAALEKQEANAQSAFEKLMQGLKSNMDGAESETSAKKILLAKTQEAKAENEGSKDAAQKELEEDTKYLKETDAMCQVRTSDFKARTKLREDEIASITKAMGIIESDTVKGAGDRNLNFIQVAGVRRQAAALAHLRSAPQNPMQGRMAVFLSERARSLGSHLLLDLAQRVSADPFKKVKKMVKDMIVQLMEEATAEMEKKGWCDTELTVNTHTRETKTDEVEDLTEEITELSADIVRLSQDNAELTSAISELDKAMMEETQERQTSKAANQKAIKEAKAAIDAVGAAMSVLKDFYAQSAEATAFVQQKSKMGDAPATFEQPYKGDQAGGAGVLGLLEVILSDFTKLESDTQSSEAMESDTYKKYMLESAKDRAMKATEISNKEGTKNDKELALTDIKAELKGAKEVLDKAIKYYEKLKPDCVDSGASYAERVKQRQAEIQSLQEALKMLS